ARTDGWRSSDGAGPRLLRWLRRRGARERPREGALRPIEPSQNRGGLQGVRTGSGRRLRQRSAARAAAALHQGPAGIALTDYRAGNLTSVRKALAAVGADVLIPERPAELHDAGGVIVPGVGHFGSTRTLDNAWVGAIRERLDEGMPLLGICLGMQWLYESS